ncbi:hypothetical protein ACIBO4_16595 [Streptomyces sp. NPDC050149]|uniref:hypothetical protein n=1 Tax=Streptomyces sp. NPDC050149 TaxID=3365603 RepID=UPI0037946C57
MNSIDALRRTLIWAAGGPGAPELSRLTEDDLLFALNKHRLESRFLYQAREDGVALPAGLADRLAKRQSECLDLIERKAELYARLRDAMREIAPDGGAAPVKGFGLYALTGEERHIRFSVDLDVLGSDPAEVARAAMSVNDVGYHHHGEDHPYVFAHMREIEVHTRYLVTGFRKGEQAGTYDVSAGTPVMQIENPFSVSAIDYPTLAANLVNSPLGPVPRAEFALLIRCAHIYVGFAMDPYPLPVATVRLDELAQVRDLIALDAFSAAEFQKLADDFDADLVVSFARTLCRELLGADPFEEAGKDADVRAVAHDWFPQNLWWDGSGAGFPVLLNWSPMDLVARDEDQPDFIHALGPAPVATGPGGAARVTFLAAGPDESSRYFWHEFHGGIGQITAEITLSDTGIRTAVTLPATPEDQMSMVGVASRDSRVELFFKPREGDSEFSDYSFAKLPAGSAGGEGRVSGETHVLTVDLPWAAFGLEQRPAPGTKVQLLLRARQQRRPWNEIAGGIVAPLLVSC